MNSHKTQKKLNEIFEVSALEATELHSKSQTLSDSFVALRNSYKIEYLAEAKTAAKEGQFTKAREFAEKTLITKMLYNAVRDPLSRRARNMWNSFGKVMDATKAFHAVCELHRIDDHPNSIVTKTFEIRHEHNDLDDFEKVIEGRRLFESLRAEVGRCDFRVLDVVRIEGSSRFDWEFRG